MEHVDIAEHSKVLVITLDGKGEIKEQDIIRCLGKNWVNDKVSRSDSIRPLYNNKCQFTFVLKQNRSSTQ
jgi:hypothetical protein